ncbi:MAG: SDR family oxidoreductase [Chloroflexota bacterium]|jgi:NAD(P)-dependent dehydrogenase (short-subunit alcohol dehydrogenase family)
MEHIDLRGKVVLVTGGGSGLGEATARAFASEGSHVACIDLNQANAERVATELNTYGVQALSFGCDVSDEEAVFRVIDDIVTQFDRLDVVVNNAAMDHTLSVDEMAVAQWDKVIAVNLRGPFLFAKAALPVMRRQQSGHIVNVSSTAATRAWANAAAYHSSKWGLVGFGRALGVEGRPDNIRVTTVIPGGMQTHFFDRFVEQNIPMPDMNNLQDPANVAEAIVFAVKMPQHSVLQEMIITPISETSWP